MTVTAEQPRTGVNHRSLDEIEDALERLEIEDIERLVAKAGAYSIGTGVEPMDLFNDAVVAVLDGSRSWPSDIKFEVFFVMSMKGIAWNLRRKARRTTVVDMSTEGHSAQDAHQRLASDVEAQTLSGIRSKELVEKVHDLLGDDGQALAIMMGRAERLSVQEICDFGDFDRKTYEAASKRVQRKMNEAVSRGVIQ